MLPRLFLLLPLAVTLTAQPPAPSPPATPASDEDELFTLGKALFDAYAPTEIKEPFTFPSRAEWDEFAARLEKTRETSTLAELAAYEPEARAALAALRVLPDYQDYADWIEERIDEIVVAKRAITPAPPPPTDPTVPPVLQPPLNPTPSPSKT